jgi:hypothetical protein
MLHDGGNMTTDQTCFSQHGPISDPGASAHLLDNLPADIDALCRVVQGTMIHIFWAERYGLKLSPEREAEVQLRTMPRRLARMAELDPRPLTEARPLERKIVGNCRDFSLTLAAMLRRQGVPARARCGFATYFLPDHFEDHWVCEYWHTGQGRWILADAQLDPFQREQLGVGFDPLDVPRDQFVTGGGAWQMCRAGRADPETFGIFDMHGLGFIRGNLVRDLAALNKVELLPWDCWGVILAGALDNPADLAALDRAAELTAGSVPDLAAVHALYGADPRFRVSGPIQSYVDGALQAIDLGL